MKIYLFKGPVVRPGLFLLFMSVTSSVLSQKLNSVAPFIRERISINDGWRFMRYTKEPDKLIYVERPQVNNRNDNVVADTRPSETGVASSSEHVLKKWILPAANDFIADPAKQHRRPDGRP